MNRTAAILLLSLLACVGITTLANAQEQRIAYVDTDVILSQLPEYQGLNQQLQLLSQEWRNRINEMQEEIDRLKKDFEAREILFTDEVRKQKREEIQQKVRQLEQYREQKFGPQGEYFQRQRELLEPIQRRVFEAITAVAQREGFDFVFDRASKTNILYSRQEWNLNNQVLLEMGVEPEDSSN